MKFTTPSTHHLLINIVHHFVVPSAGVDSGNDARRQAVHQFAQDDAVPERILKRYWWKAFPNHGLDPVLRLSLLLWLPLSRDLQGRVWQIGTFVLVSFIN